MKQIFEQAVKDIWKMVRLVLLLILAAVWAYPELFYLLFISDDQSSKVALWFYAKLKNLSE